MKRAYIVLFFVTIVFTLRVLLSVNGSVWYRGASEWIFFALFFVLLIWIFRLLQQNEKLNQKLNQEQETNQQFTHILENIDAEIFIADFENKKVVYSNQVAQAFNESQATCQAILFDTKQVCENCPVCGLDTDTLYTSEDLQIKEINKNGRWYECKTLLLKENENKPTILILKETTLQKNLVQRVLRAELDFKEMLDAFPVGVSVTDMQKKVILLNRAVSQLFETEDTDLLGKEINQKFSLVKLSEQDSYNKIQDLEKYSFKNKAGVEVFLYKKEVPVELQGIKGFLESYIDITQIELARKGEEKANKAKSEFLANMSHEIRNPLNGIIGLAEVLSTSDLSAQHRDYAGIIKKSADMLLSIINDILDFSKIEAGKMVLEEIPFNLKEEVLFVVETFKYAAKEKNIELVTHCGNVPDKIIGDPFRLRQIITNLVGNALKFTEEGTIQVSVDIVKDGYENIIALFSVEDTGIGIAKEKQHLIFSSFSQADGSTTRKYGGTGLGTTISKELVEMMDGEIWLESPSTISTNPKYPGSKFNFTAEFINDKKFEKRVKVDISELRHLQTIIVDSPSNKTNVLAESFKKLGIPTEMFYDRDDLIIFLKRKFMHPDMPKIIFIEHTPDFDGLRIAQAIDEIDYSDFYIIVLLSSNDQRGNYSKCKRFRVDYYVIKPYENSEILDIIGENFKNLNIKQERGFETETLNKNISILVAEDNLMNQKVVQIIFKSIGYEIELAENGNQAIEKVKSKDYDIIFMDFMMPHKDGVQATIELREMGCQIPIIAMTGKATEEDERIALNAGMNDFIPKPVTISLIKNTLVKWFLHKK